MRYADARETMPQPRVVAGVSLRPFCLGHHLHFKALGLPFHGNPAADCGREDLVLGIAVCGLSYEATTDAIANDQLAGIVEGWRKQVQGPWWNPRMIDWSGVEASFREHLIDGYRMPPIWKRDGTGITLSAPWEVLIKTRLLSVGLSESEILNGYLPARWYEYFAAVEISASERCEDVKQWRKLFFTQEDAEQLGAVE